MDFFVGMALGVILYAVVDLPFRLIESRFAKDAHEIMTNEQRAQLRRRANL